VTSTIDTTHFSSHEASGSTSQAANVAEAIELGAKVFLVDEDVSAANFMARDGRMRALVMDESITPLLYRVNGMSETLGISCIVVVGGVGDWLGKMQSLSAGA
jgi:predicted ABC-class ATPase